MPKHVLSQEEESQNRKQIVTAFIFYLFMFFNDRFLEPTLAVGIKNIVACSKISSHDHNEETLR